MTPKASKKKPVFAIVIAFPFKSLEEFVVIDRPLTPPTGGNIPQPLTSTQSVTALLSVGFFFKGVFALNVSVRLVPLGLCHHVQPPPACVSSSNDDGCPTVKL